MYPHPGRTGDSSGTEFVEWDNRKTGSSVLSCKSDRSIGVTESAVVRQGEYCVGFHHFQHSFIFWSLMLLDVSAIYFAQYHDFYDTWNRCKQPLPSFGYRIDRLYLLIALLFFMYGKKLVQALDISTLTVRKLCKSIDYRVYFSDLWNIIRLKMLAILPTDAACEESPVPKPIPEDAILATGTVLYVIITDTHRILGE